ncbi:NAD(P)-binding domain-containing protein, partial [Bacillus paranthracis]|uniref:NAD(P)-binding domain-containing protein n=1 Tax=Bacillus paranthracis TaxID=2026186 RepID=UPI00284D9244
KNAFHTKYEIEDYLETYHVYFSLSGQLETTVHKVEKTASTFEVSTNKGVLRSKNVIIASGAFQKLFIPSISQHLSQELFQIN